MHGLLSKHKEVIREEADGKHTFPYVAYASEAERDETLKKACSRKDNESQYKKGDKQKRNWNIQSEVGSD